MPVKPRLASSAVRGRVSLATPLENTIRSVVLLMTEAGVPAFGARPASWSFWAC